LNEALSNSERNTYRTDLRNSIISVAPVFAEYPYFMSAEFSLVDCCIAPILWRLPVLEIDLPAQAKAVLEYANNIFARDTFQASLTDSEIAMRKDR
jgi:RNA polymerase-associated protein